MSYGKLAAVRGVSIVVRRGAMLALLGPNGAGKTSLLRAVAGLERVITGRVTFLGQDVTGLAAERRVRLGMSFVPEGRGVLAGMTVAENLMLGYFAGNRREAASKRLSVMYERWPILSDRRRQPAGTLSGGEQQMLVIARAMLADPQLLVLDEPSFGLSPLAVEQVFRTIQELKESGMTIVASEQNASQALEVADEIVVLEHGEESRRGSAQDMRTAAAAGSVYEGLVDSN